MTKKLLTPNQSNRQECLEQLWDKLYLSDKPSGLMEGIYLNLGEYLKQKRCSQVAAALSHVCAKNLDRAIALRRSEDVHLSGELFKKSFAHAYWCREIDQCVRTVDAWDPDIGDDDIHTMVSWQALSIACGNLWFAVWVAPHLHNQFGYPGKGINLMEYSLDKPATRFMALLQQSLVTRQWPEQIDTDVLSGYGPLLAALADENSWPDALVAFCDWRVANAYGYDYMGATKRRRQSAGWSVLDNEHWYQVFPLELILVQFAYERATGRRVSLQAEHPMLQSPLMTAPFPAIEPMYDDEWLQRAKQLRAETFGAKFELRQDIRALYL
jgi:hypothetical protein